MICKVFLFKDHSKIEQEINNWFLLNKNFEVKHIVQSYAPPVIIPIKESDPIKKDPAFRNASYTEIQSYIIITIFYEIKE